VGGLGVEFAALEDKPRNRGGQNDHECSRRNQQQIDLAHPGADCAAHPAGIAARGEAAEGWEQDRGDGDTEHTLGQHVDAKGVIDRARSFFGDQATESRVDELVEVDDPRPMVTGSMSVKTWRIRGSCQSMLNCRRKSIRPSVPSANISWTPVAARMPIAYA